MTHPTARIRLASITLLSSLAVLAGCHVDHHTDGDKENVKVATPFGGLSVRTNGDDVQSMIGLDVYPGATPEKKKKGDDGAADINLSFGDFHLGVKAAGYTTPDDQGKVQAFYRKALARYGTVIECRKNQVVGTPVRTDQGLTCENEGKRIQVDEGDAAIELKAGSKSHQHVVEIDPRGSGTKFGLVLLDLPTGLGKAAGSSGDQEDKQ